MFTTLNLTDKFGGKFENSRCQCYCGAEYTPSPDSGCPACGKLVPRAMASETGAWMTPQQWKMEGLKRMLEPDALEQVPTEFREAMQLNIKRQIRQLYDGSWKAQTKQRIQSFRRMLAPEHRDRIPADEREKMTARLALHIKRLQEELAIAGETMDENALADPPVRFGDGIFTRPKVTSREWDEDPMQVTQKVAMAIALHIQHDKMTQVQRALVYSWYYAQSVSEPCGGHGQILFGRAAENEPTQDEFIASLESVFTPAHLTVFQKAQSALECETSPIPEAAP